MMINTNKEYSQVKSYISSLVKNSYYGIQILI